jgi:hypothetical protein
VCSARTFVTYATATQELEPHLQKIKEQGFQLKEFDPDEVKQVTDNSCLDFSFAQNPHRAL